MNPKAPKERLLSVSDCGILVVVEGYKQVTGLLYHLPDVTVIIMFSIRENYTASKVGSVSHGPVEQCVS